YFLRPLGPVALVLLLGAVFVASVLSWRFIERPVRKGTVLRRRASLFAAAGIGIVGFSAARLACHFSDGFAGRMPTSVLALEAARQPESLTNCAPPPGAFYGGMCQVGAGARRFIVWGDSHAG